MNNILGTRTGSGDVQYAPAASGRYRARAGDG